MLSKVKRALMVTVLLCISSTAWADFTFVQISDTHVALDQPAWNGRFNQAIKEINEIKPDFVIHTGDLLNAWSKENAAEFLRLRKALAAPLFAVPGNHDVCDIEDWKKDFGYDHISFSKDDTVFIGLNSNLFNKGTDAEKEQLKWFKSELAKSAGKRIFIFEHSPLFVNKPDDANGAYFGIDNPARSAVLDLLKAYKVKAVITGHIHSVCNSSFNGILFNSSAATSFSCGADNGRTGYSVYKVSKDGFQSYFVDLRRAGNPPAF